MFGIESNNVGVDSKVSFDCEIIGWLWNVIFL